MLLCCLCKSKGALTCELIHMVFSFKYVHYAIFSKSLSHPIVYVSKMCHL